ncbi:MAG TPA: GNAT family N-acetyltransferase [Thermoplasmata archaeon]|nr:GNAT family N-acetyltransferase [Thermoplasmata archaeon]
MPVEMDAPGIEGLFGVIRALREWPRDGAPMQLHPGDLGWFGRFGAADTAAAVRTWSRSGAILAVGLKDHPGTVRLAIAPDAVRDEELADRLLDDLTRPERGVVGAGRASVEARTDARIRGRLLEAGWYPADPWVPLVRDLARPVEPVGLRVERVGPSWVGERVAVQRAAFDGSTFTVARWRAMAAGPAYADARCLVAFEPPETAVAAATVWSAGPGRPGLLEPLGVHRDHRGHGYGTAIARAAAAALREMGASSAVVGTPASNTRAVATYRAAGFAPGASVRDLERPA